ncbi:hypothetical protein [Ruegeria arenilitoris]|uniref:hypothetical protein n=1 Tax=Ruegeria arenilitoris TaxID=1173585 RepID=UPI00147B103D|nr:hypothetical protein [Ruegeria arenilitoris]
MYSFISASAAGLAHTQEFARRYLTLTGEFTSLSHIEKSKVQEILNDDRDGLFAAQVEKIQAKLKDPEIGIAAVDIPTGIMDNAAADTLCACLAATAISSAIAEPTENERNATPFTLYNASQKNEDKLKEAGLKFYSPEERLGFHTDGQLRPEGVFVPDFISVYNVMIAYRQPGSFYYLPFELWREREEFREAFGVNQDVRFSLTPIVYAGQNGEIESSDGRVIKAPVFWSDGTKERVFFNGEVDVGSKVHIQLSRDMSRSLLDNPERIACPIRNRRLFIMSNSRGFHARDVFSDPIKGVPYTRSFIRFVSRAAQQVKKSEIDRRYAQPMLETAPV